MSSISSVLRKDAKFPTVYWKKVGWKGTIAGGIDLYIERFSFMRNLSLNENIF